MTRARLITSRGFGRPFLSSIAVIGAVAAVGSRFEPATAAVERVAGTFQMALIRTAHQHAQHYLASAALGLLASSCCALQLFLGAFSFGCAGFNTVLGPIRPQLLALTCAVQAWMWHEALFDGLFEVRSCAISSALCAALALLPEVLAWRLERSSSAERPRRALSLDFKIEGMGCIACATAVSEVVRLTCGASSTASVDLDAATLRVVAARRGAEEGADADALSKSLATELAKAGFPATPLHAPAGRTVSPSRAPPPAS